MSAKASLVQSGEFSLLVYPSPAKEYFTLSYYLPASENLVVELLDVSGRVVLMLDEGLKASGKQEKLCSISNLSKGIYLLRLQTESKTLSTKLLVE